ncbi:MAG: OmpA family protein [Cyclobacteriaceae bacterium]|nr:OmpA family protein [Cyclobacteriaceae bacterium]UYN87520.1 MAG: OmpA family protein [Cyclobacteriaceae bacterium]
MKVKCWKVLVFLLFGLFLLPVGAIAQVQLSTKSKKAIELYNQADNYRVRGQHEQAITLLNQAIAKDKNFAEAYYRLGLVYMNMKNYPSAISNFEKGLTLTTDPKKQKVYWFDLGEAYLITGQYDKAVKYLTDFVKVENQNRQKAERAEQLLKNAAFAQANAAVNAEWKLRPLSDTVNRFPLQYFPVLTADQQELFFTRRLGSSGEHDEDLVVSRKDDHGRWTSPVSISKNINSVLNEGTCAISADGRKLIFTSCMGRQSFGSCDLYQSIKIGNEWTEPVNLGPNVNSSEWESQPALSADGRTLYFVSDRRGGLGRRDIWVSSLDEKGQWAKAKNLGPPINTQYDEISPFIHANNKVLYFASKGHTGFGGYDLFSSERTEQGWSEPINIGSPINDFEDQFSLFITADGKRGYFSHEETTGQGNTRSRIYEIQFPEDHQVRYKSNFVNGTIRDKQTGKELKATIELFNINSNQIEAVVESDSISGDYLMVLTQGAEYALYINRKGYLFTSSNFNYSERTDFEPIRMDFALEQAKKGSSVVLNNIFFETNKYDLQGKSITELQKIIRFLTESPQIQIEIGGHTDNTGNPAYNLQLSEKRALSVYNYLINNGVNRNSITWRGYGQSQPVATNDTEEGRAQNRRIVFKIQ